MKLIFKIIPAFLLIAFVNGCALTEAILITSGSYLLTGKSVSDNALSLAINMDCKTHNILYGKAICNEIEDTLVQDKQSILTLTPTLLDSNKSSAVVEKTTSESSSNNAVLAKTINSTKSIETAQQSTNFNAQSDMSSSNPIDETNTNVASISPTDIILENSNFIQIESNVSNRENFYRHKEQIENRLKLYAVVGSFHDLGHAKYRKILYTDYQAFIREHRTKNGLAHRVLIGPLNQKVDISNIPSQLDTEKADPWTILLCEKGQSLPPCPTGTTNHSLLARASGTE